MALKAGYKGIKGPIADQLNALASLGELATDAEIAAAVQQIYADNGILGAKNLIPFNLEQVKANNTSGTWSGNAYTYNGVTFTINTDGSIKITGTASALAQLYFTRRTSYDFKLAKGSYIYNGVTSGSGSSFWVSVGKNRVTGDSSQGVVELGNDYGDSLAFDLSETSDIQLLINVAKNYACPASGITIYPMIRLASDSDPTFQPYAATNRELTVNKVDNSVIGNVEDTTTASQAYAVGEHFIKDGKFCTAIQAIAAEATFVKNTNYVEGNISDFLTAKSDTVSLSAAATTAGISLVTGHTDVLTFGRVKISNLRFVVTSDLTLSSDLSIIQNMPYCEAMDYHKFLAHSQTKPYEIQSWAGYIYHTSLVIPNGATIAAGQYDIVLVYI